MKRKLQNVAFRVDASLQIGMGHLMRCLTLADAARARGAHTRFLCRALPENLKALMYRKGHELYLLEGGGSSTPIGDLEHSHWLGASQGQDSHEALCALSDRVWDWLIVDHYGLDARWEWALRAAATKIMAIDDLADRQHDCDLLLDQNLYADMNIRYVGKVPAHCRMLLGTRYALLRDEFGRLRGETKPRSGAVKRIFVSFGGVDLDNYTSMAIEALARIGDKSLHVDVVIGVQHPFRGDIEAACETLSYRCHVQTTRMAELMAAADLAIGAGGSTSWERCCLGLPALALCVAENQRQLIGEAALRGLLYTPDTGGHVVDVIERHARALMENGYLRQAISSNGMNAVDGRGVLRVIKHLGCGGIEIREATREDARQLFEWRNDPSIRAVSRTAEKIDWNSHQNWLSAVLSDLDRVLLIGERGGVPVGVVRFDVCGDSAEISIYRVPGIEEPGTGSELLQSAEHWLATHRPELRYVRAHVLKNNDPSHRLFLGDGYQIESTRYSKRLR